MKKYEINKYPPSLFKDGRFLREDWGACTDIGRATPRGVLDKAEYLRVEALYVTAVANIARTVEPELLRVHDVEFWETTSDRLASVGLADVLDGSADPSEGEPVVGVRLDNLVRRCLREVAWLELMNAPTLLVHFGYDMHPHQIALALRIEREDLVAIRLGLLGALEERRRRLAVGEHPFHGDA